MISYYVLQKEQRQQQKAAIRNKKQQQLLLLLLLRKNNYFKVYERQKRRSSLIIHPRLGRLQYCQINPRPIVIRNPYQFITVNAAMSENEPKTGWNSNPLVKSSQTSLTRTDP